MTSYHKKKKTATSSRSITKASKYAIPLKPTHKLAESKRYLVTWWGDSEGPKGHLSLLPPHKKCVDSVFPKVSQKFHKSITKVLNVLIVFFPIVCKLVVLKVTTWTIAWILENSQKFIRCLRGQVNLVNKTVFRIGFKLHCYIQELDRHKKSKKFYELLDWPN